MAAWKLHVQKHNIMDTAVLGVCGTPSTQPHAVLNKNQGYFILLNAKNNLLAYYWLAAQPVLPQDCHCFSKKVLHYQWNQIILAMWAQKLQIGTVYAFYHSKKIKGLSAQ